MTPEEQAAELLPCDGECHKVTSSGYHMLGCFATKRRVLTAALAEKDKEIERLQYELTVIGDMAVVDFDDAVVGMVDKVLPEKPKTYKELRRKELQQVADLRAKNVQFLDLIKCYKAKISRALEHIDVPGIQCLKCVSLAIENLKAILAKEEP